MGGGRNDDRGGLKSGRGQRDDTEKTRESEGGRKGKEGEAISTPEDQTKSDQGPGLLSLCWSEDRAEEEESLEGLFQLPTLAAAEATCGSFFVFFGHGEEEEEEGEDMAVNTCGQRLQRK